MEKSKKVSLSKENEAKFSNIILPFWLAAFLLEIMHGKLPMTKNAVHSLIFASVFLVKNMPGN